jgi:hypothetical protein
MKNLISIIILSVLICVEVNGFPQELILPASGEVRAKTKDFNLIVQNEEMRTLLSKVLPGVTLFVSENYTIVPAGHIFALLYQNQYYSIQQINSLLLEIKYNEDTNRLVSDKDLLKTYMYLEIASRQICQDSCIFSIPVKFDVRQIEKTYFGEIYDYYKKIGFNNFTLNYSISASWNSNNTLAGENFWHFDFNIVNREFVSVAKKITTGQIPEKQKLEFHAFKYSDEMEKCDPTGKAYRKQYLENEKKSKDLD